LQTPFISWKLIYDVFENNLNSNGTNMLIYFFTHSFDMTKDNSNDKDKGKMTVEEAGRKGGEAVVEKYGPEHMAEIGRKGGEHSHGGRDYDDDDKGKKSHEGSNSKRGLASADKETRERVAKKGGES
jgi:general stress protein YciG